MVISLFFSFGIYRLLTAELDRFEQMQQRRLEARMQVDPIVSELPEGAQKILKERMLDTSIIDEAKLRIKLALLIINLAILATSFAAGYFLAGKTLLPIREMIDEQSRFITDSSHELRTPLTALRSEMEVSLRDKNLKLKDAKEIIKSNLEEVIAIQRLSDNLLKLTKSFNQNKRIGELKVNEIIDYAVKKVSPMAKQKNIEINAKSDNTIIFANELEMTELLIIFLDNAIKYSPDNSSIEIIEKKKGSSIEVKVKDYGIGIEQKDLPHLFERFYRADKSRSKNDSEGFGLGLSIAKRIVDNNSGKIEVESEVEKGTTFIITLPIK
jgi:signal transduction histidine kinase